MPYGYIPIQVAGYPQVISYPQQPNFMQNLPQKFPIMEAPMEIIPQESVPCPTPLPVQEPK